MSGFKQIAAYKFIVEVFGKAPWRSKLPIVIFTEDYLTQEEAERAAESYVVGTTTMYGLPVRAVVSKMRVETTVQPLKEFRRPLGCIPGGKIDEPEGMSGVTEE